MKVVLHVCEKADELAYNWHHLLKKMTSYTVHRLKTTVSISSSKRGLSFTSMVKNWTKEEMLKK